MTTQCVDKFLILLTGDGEDPVVSDVYLPATSISYRQKQAALSSMDVVIPTFDYAAQISARSNGEIVLYWVYESDGTTDSTQELGRTNLNDIIPSEGATNRSIQLRGSKTQTYTPEGISLGDGITYRSTNLTDGKQTWRIPKPILNLKAGCTVGYDGDSLIVGTIAYSFTATSMSIDLQEE
jgi:hypothetical protein